MILKATMFLGEQWVRCELIFGPDLSLSRSQICGMDNDDKVQEAVEEFTAGSLCLSAWY